MNDVLTAALRRAADHQHRFEARFAAHLDALADPAAGPLEPPPHGRFPARALALVRELSLRGGKRLRVALLHEAAALATDRPVPGLDAAAIGIELLHTHGLIHDDLIDDAPVRRGGPSTYHAYRQEFPDRPDTALALTVLAGDLAAFLAVRALLSGDLPPERALAMATVVTDAAAAAVNGQLLDLERDFHPAPETGFLHTVTEYKSTRYSILAPLRLGLLAAGADPAPRDADLRAYATALGIANQIHDDWLDLFGDPAALGKPLGTDIRAGRRSYLVRALLAATADDAPARATLHAVLGVPHPDEDALAELRDLARARGLDRTLHDEAARHARRAATLATAWQRHWRPDAVAFFTHLPAWSVTRDH
ncbi:polyprenyl synthetase family protein [Kitasatospora sp. NPDC088783]|uniref:polyprenyl synthetase family protein n=1 Tax=Kitasatospora sp. NPDC088783 TaxID=3364077 RepID=UPI00380F48D1